MRMIMGAVTLDQRIKASSATLIASTCVLFSSDISLAKANEPASLPLYGLKKDRLLPCRSRSKCISSSSINSREKYGRPWSFDDAKPGKNQFEEIKTALNDIAYLNVKDVNDDKLYIRAEAKSAVPPSGIDDIELFVNELDHIITYRSNSRDVVMAGASVVPDGGSNRNRLSAIQRKLNLKEMSLNPEVEEMLGAKPDFFSYQKRAQSPSDINFLDNSVPDKVKEAN